MPSVPLAPWRPWGEARGGPGVLPAVSVPGQPPPMAADLPVSGGVSSAPAHSPAVAPHGPAALPGAEEVGSNGGEPCGSFLRAGDPAEAPE